MLSQFVVENTLKKKGAQSIHTKILLQMIAKRSNILWAPTFKGEIDEKLVGVCLMGIDSSSSGGKTIMSGCATLNSTFSLFSSATVTVKDSANKYLDMLAVATKCHEGYFKRLKRSADELIIFINAVPADQVKPINELFCQILRDQMKSAYNKETKLTVIMVNLRNSERFFSEIGLKNVLPGTLVSSEIISKIYEFYIVSQQSTKGSVVPNHYRVIFRSEKSQL